MNTPAGVPESPDKVSAWESLDPWEKAAQWRRVAPEISQQILELAAEKAKEQMERDRVRDQFLMKLQEKEQGHRQLMERRLWLMQLIGVLGGLVCIGLLVLVSWHYADSGNLGPGLGIFGIGSGLTAGIYGAGAAMAKKSARQSKALSESQKPAGAQGGG